MTVGGNRPRLRGRIAVAIGFVCLASILTTGLYLRQALEAMALDAWRRERLSDATTLAVAFDQRVDELINELRLVAATPAMSRLDASRVDPAINGIPRGVDEDKRRTLDALLDEGWFSVLFILQPNGDHYLSHPFSVQQGLKRFNLADRPYVAEAARLGRPTLSNVFLGADGKPAVAIDAPSLSESGELILHLGGVIHLPHLAELFRKTINDQFESAVLLDRQGEVIATAGAMGSLQTALAMELRHFQAEATAPTLAAPRTFFDPARDEEVTAAFVRLRSGWAVALARGRSSFVEQIKPDLTRIVVVVGCLLLLTGMIGFIIANHMAARWEGARNALALAHDELEERVRQRTADLESILDNVSHGISLFDQNLRLVTANKWFNELLALPAALNRPGAALTDHLRTIAARGEYGEGDVEDIVRDRLAPFLSKRRHHSQRLGVGGRVLDVVIEPLADGRFVVTHTDVTEAKRAEESLLTLSRAIEQSPVSVVITDPKGNIEYVNPKFVEITGFGFDEVKGQNPRVLKSGLVTDGTYADLWKIISAGGAWEGDLWNRKKSGELFWERATISPIRSPEGEVIHYLAVKEDITARKKAEADLVAAWHAAEEANRAKTVFLSHMSHELRTPLTAVLGYAEMMHVQIAGPLPEDYVDYVDSIMSSGSHLLSIIDEVLDISRIELGSFRISTTELDLSIIAGECVAMVKPQCAAKGIAIAMARAEPAPIKSDDRALRQVLINLLSNAVKYTPEGGSISVSVAPTPEGGAMASLTDSGCGIPDEKLDHIFEPFQRVDPLRADPARGVGLGLAICRRIIDLLGGTIRLQSRPGHGTSVTVILPPAPDQPKSD